jgi:hypothetical protein
MLRRTMTAVLAITLIAIAGSSMAQPCVVGIYTDAAGTQSVHTPILGENFDVFIVIRVESTVAGVAYSITWPGHVNGTPLSYGPNGLGLDVTGPGGDQNHNVGLGECAIGFANQSIVVTHYQAFAFAVAGPSQVTLGPNTDESPTSPVFADCGSNISPCGGVQALLLDGVIGTEAASFGAVKSLYGN